MIIIHGHCSDRVSAESVHYTLRSDGVPFAGTVWRGLIFFTTDRPDYHRMPPPAGDNHGWVVFAVRTGFALGHRASTFHACAHLITTAVRYQLRAQGRYFVPRTQHGRWGHREKSRRASTRCDCRGKSRPA